MIRIRSCRVNGRRWRVAWDVPNGDLGLCEHDQHTIRINPKMDNPATTDTLIHEWLHARWPDLDEASVYTSATEISAMLERAGLIAED